MRSLRWVGAALSLAAGVVCSARSAEAQSFGERIRIHADLGGGVTMPDLTVHTATMPPQYVWSPAAMVNARFGVALTEPVY